MLSKISKFLAWVTRVRTSPECLMQLYWAIVAHLLLLLWFAGQWLSICSSLKKGHKQIINSLDICIFSNYNHKEAWNEHMTFSFETEIAEESFWEQKRKKNIFLVTIMYHKQHTWSHSSIEASVAPVPTSTFGAFLVFYTPKKRKKRCRNHYRNITTKGEYGYTISEGGHASEESLSFYCNRSTCASRIFFFSTGCTAS